MLPILEGFNMALVGTVMGSPNTEGEVEAAQPGYTGYGLVAEPMASGSLVRSPTFGLIGEGGETEIVSPVSMMRSIVREEQTGLMKSINLQNELLEEQNALLLQMNKQQGRFF